MQLLWLSTNIVSRWQEIRFAYEKPTVVQSIRLDYEQKYKELEKSFLQKKQTAQDKLLEEVTKKLQENSLK